MLEITSLDVITRQEYERDLEKSELFYGRQKEWDREFKMFLDVYQSKLFVAMREGQVRTYGRKLPRPTIQEAMDLSAPESWEGWNETEWTQIPENFWSSERINWEECRAEGKGGAFALILVDCKDLFRCFPIPDGKPIIGVYEIGDALVLGGEKQGRVSSQSRRGRPSFNWDEFHVEVAKRIRDTGLPAKREAFIAEMQEWCKGKWSREVGRSTILQKLKLYYDGLS